MTRLGLFLTMLLATVLGSTVSFLILIRIIFREDKIEKNNVVEFVGEDEDGNGIYKFKN